MSRTPTDNFSFRPKFFPELDDCVRDLVWDSVAKTLRFHIKETPDFSVMHWLAHIEEQNREYDRSPFIDTERNRLTVSVTDENGEVVAGLEFRDLSLVGHACSLRKGEPTSPLGHHLTLTYRSVNAILPKRKTTHEDEQWQNGPSE